MKKPSLENRKRPRTCFAGIYLSFIYIGAGRDRMADVTAVKERASFSARLKNALDNAGFEKMTCTALAREFNMRSEGDPVTVHAVRKWMVGEAIPGQEKLVVLARWLAVNPEWLRFGDVHHAMPPVRRLGTEDQVLLQDLAMLDADGKTAVRALVAILLNAMAQRVSGAEK